jgi:dolichol-phosphate mannosyltransferase
MPVHRLTTKSVAPVTHPGNMTAAAESDDVPLVSVVVPAYREAENLPVLIPRLHAALQQAGLSAEIIVVDDNSPDATPQVMAKLAEEFPVRLIVRTAERGLSSAVVRGMQEARGEILVCMDADLSHPPEKVPELVAALLEQQGDFVIGSRYVAGGRTDDEWGWFRRLNSRVATLLARPLTTARDPMAGFFALRRETFRAAEPLDPIGYKIGLELMVKCRCQRVREIPIHFHDRLHGESKLSLKEQVNYLRHLGRLYRHRLGRWGQPLLFGAVGASGMVVDLTVLTVLMLWLEFEWARAVAILVAMTWNFFLNRHFTFDGAHTGPILKQYALFCLSCGLGAVVNWSVSSYLWNSWEKVVRHPAIAAVCGIAAGVTLNYLLSAAIVFRPAPDSRSSDKQ